MVATYFYNKDLTLLLSKLLVCTSDIHPFSSLLNTTLSVMK